MMEFSKWNFNACVIDFEGNLKVGINEISYLIINDFKICHTTYKLPKNKYEIISTLESMSEYRPQLFIAHNSHIEYNLIKLYFPVMPSVHRDNKRILWGPWIDTLVMYKKLYPKIKNYTLENLTSIFLDKKSIESISKAYSSKAKHTFHCSLYDALCTFMLLRHAGEKINLSNFIFDFADDF